MFFLKQPIAKALPVPPTTTIAPPSPTTAEYQSRPVQRSVTESALDTLAIPMTAQPRKSTESGPLRSLTSAIGHIGVSPATIQTATFDDFPGGEDNDIGEAAANAPTQASSDLPTGWATFNAIPAAIDGVNSHKATANALPRSVSAPMQLATTTLPSGWAEVQDVEQVITEEARRDSEIRAKELLQTLEKQHKEGMVLESGGEIALAIAMAAEKGVGVLHGTPGVTPALEGAEWSANEKAIPPAPAEDANVPKPKAVTETEINAAQPSAQLKDDNRRMSGWTVDEDRPKTAEEIVEEEVTARAHVILNEALEEGAATPTPVQAVETVIRSEAAATPTTAVPDNDIEEEAQIGAQRIYNGDEDFLLKEKAVIWLGDAGEVNALARQAYMTFFDWTGVNPLLALRRLCSQLFLKAETQQIDRILEGFARRWWECNNAEACGMKNVDVVHAIAYSLLLLNTDLHVADLSSTQHMNRTQFTKNTISAVRAQVKQDSMPRSQSSYSMRSSPGVTPGEESPGEQPKRPSLGRPASSYSSYTMPKSYSTGNGSLANLAQPSTPTRDSPTRSASGLSVGKPWSLYDDRIGPYGAFAAGGSMRGWEMQLECLLKDFYASIKASQILQPLSSRAGSVTPNHRQEKRGNRLSVGTPGSLNRSPSTVSYTPSEASVGRFSNVLAGRRPKSRPRITTSSFTHGNHSQTSLSDLRSPSGHNHGRPMSIASTDSDITTDSRQSRSRLEAISSIGFANTLTHAIIREEASIASPMTSSFDIAEAEEDALALTGPPWAKEGLLNTKHYADASGRKPKLRTWTQCFAVIDKGELKLFKFGTQHGNYGGVVGGGNWSQNADMIGSFLLRHTLATKYPAPGYSKSRQHVWMLKVHTGAVHLFHAGTAELVEEWTYSANYWAARTSKEPLAGAVSNIEYGWGVVLDGFDSSTASFDSPRVPTSATQRSQTPSLHWDRTVKTRLPGDSARLEEFQPPMPSLIPSNFPESEQLRALKSRLSHLTEDHAQHARMKPLLARAFSPRSPNLGKALSNWEKKSQWLGEEVGKYEKYVMTLAKAVTERAQKQPRLSMPRSPTSPNVISQGSMVSSPVSLGPGPEEKDETATGMSGASKSERWKHRATWSGPIVATHEAKMTEMLSTPSKAGARVDRVSETEEPQQ
ncbi:hypothetical protein SAICODRAFT_4742 [Saitoella complicata NRRL Y-17804]|nr:uncharacterized protein SAICODRAFT_4742 [Saitoella complicata NRRL Y-17804]ODQ56563.1 hypothetical protein SAICODRAFT_4742 [Saitoella complicata NRRL Y-17804]